MLLLGLLYIVERGWSVDDWAWAALHHSHWTPCFQVLVPDPMTYVGDSQNHLVSVLPGSGEEQLREGQPEPNPQCMLLRSCYQRGELTGSHSPEECRPSGSTSCSLATPSREGRRRPAAAPSPEHYPTENLTEYHQSPTFPFSSSFRDPILIYNHTPTLSSSWPTSR